MVPFYFRSSSMFGWRDSYVASQFEPRTAEHDDRGRARQGCRDRFDGLFCGWENCLDERRGRHCKAYVTMLKSSIFFMTLPFISGFRPLTLSSCFPSVGFTVVQEAGIGEDRNDDVVSTNECDI